MYKGKYGIIAAMKIEAELIIAAMEETKTETVGSIEFTLGKLRRENPHAGGEVAEADVIVAVCGIGKVFAAMCAQTMIVKYAPDYIINTGVAGTLSHEIGIGDVVIASGVVEHDMDTSPLGDPVGWISGLDLIEMPCSDRLVMSELRNAAAEVLAETGNHYIHGLIASGDRFVADDATKKQIIERFGAVACEMEGGAVGQVCTANKVPFAVIRAISDDADGGAVEDYPAFAKKSAETSARILIHAITMIF